MLLSIKTNLSSGADQLAISSKPIEIALSLVMTSQLEMDANDINDSENDLSVTSANSLGL